MLKRTKFTRIKSFAKVNLSLNVIGRLKNNYHQIESLVTFVNLHDEILVRYSNRMRHTITFGGKFSKGIKKNNNTVKNLLELLDSKNYLNNNYLLNKNFNGKLMINIDNIYGSKYLDGIEISFSFFNGKINLNGSKISLDKLGVIHLNDFNILTKKNKVLLETKNLFEVSNLDQFNRVFQLPKNKKRNIQRSFIPCKSME